MKGVQDKIPLFVSNNPGLDSGYMIAHVTATSLASENKTLSHPASVDSLPTSGGQEDLVSMAPWAGYKLINIQENLNRILSIELIVAGAANNIAVVKLKPGTGTLPVLKILNKHCSFRKGDRSLSAEIEIIANIISSGKLEKSSIKTNNTGVKVKNRPPFKQAFTFDDILLVPQKSSILPRDVKLKNKID